MLSLVGSHILSKLRDNDTCVTEVGSPALYPFKRDIAGVVDSIEGSNHLLNGDITCAHDTVLYLAVSAHNGVLDLDILDVLAEVSDSSLRRLTVEAVGMMHIPQSSYLAASDCSEKVSKTRRIAVHAVSLNKESNIVILSHGNELSEAVSNVSVVNVSAGSGLKVAEDSYIRCAELVCELGICGYFFLYSVELVLEFKAGARSKARDLKSESS